MITRTYKPLPITRAKLYVTLLSAVVRDEGEEAMINQASKQHEENASIMKRTSIKDINVLCDLARPRATAAEGEAHTGVVSEDDLWRFAAPIRPQLRATVHHRFHEAIELTLQSMAKLMFGICDISDIDSEANMASELPHYIENFQGELLRMRQEVARAGNRIHSLIAELELAHRRLQSELTECLSLIPQEQGKINMASNGLLAASIETSLIKLSLIRARAHQSLYGFKTTSSSNHDVTRALSAAHNKATREARHMKDEAAALDKQIQEYEELLGLVDKGGGYKQVIEDWTRVKQDTEECRRDLRRLGWTGD